LKSVSNDSAVSPSAEELHRLFLGVQYDQMFVLKYYQF